MGDTWQFVGRLCLIFFSHYICFGESQEILIGAGHVVMQFLIVTFFMSRRHCVAKYKCYAAFGFLAALAVLHWTILIIGWIAPGWFEKRMNSSYSSKLSLSPQTEATTFAFSSVFILLHMGGIELLGQRRGIRFRQAVANFSRQGKGIGNKIKITFTVFRVIPAIIIVAKNQIGI